MAAKSLSGFFRKLEAIEQVNKKYPYRAAVLAVNFTKDRFRQQNWIGDRTEPWDRRQFQPGGRNTLVGKGSGALKRSFRIVSHNSRRAVVGSDKPYARAHNEGARILITPKMRKFFMAKHIELKAAGRTQEAQYFLNLSVTKKKYFTIKKRQFAGESPYMIRQIDRQWAADNAKALKTR
jgi:phage gpG-like protein